MYYIINNYEEFYAGKEDSNNYPVWKHHESRALPFDDVESAMNYAKRDNIFYLGIKLIKE